MYTEVIGEQGMSNNTILCGNKYRIPCADSPNPDYIIKDNAPGDISIVTADTCITIKPDGTFFLDGELINKDDEERGKKVYEGFVKLLHTGTTRVTELEAECQRLRDAISEITPPQP